MSSRNTVKYYIGEKVWFPFISFDDMTPHYEFFTGNITGIFCMLESREIGYTVKVEKCSKHISEQIIGVKQKNLHKYYIK